MSKFDAKKKLKIKYHQKKLFNHLASSLKNFEPPLPMRS
jgi:hypothetical protein